MKLFGFLVCLLIIQISVKYLNREEKIYDAKEFEKKIREKQTECWKNAVLHINGSCKTLDVNDQRLLAVKFTQCHLDAIGRKLPDYTPDTDFKLYNTRYLKGDAFFTYTSFFIHVDNLCFYLQNEIWCDSADRTINELNYNSDTMKHSLDILLENEFQLVSNQNISLKHHQMIIENEILLIAESEKAKNMIFNMQIEVNQSFSMLDSIMSSNNKTVTDFVSIIGRYLSKIEFLQKYLVDGIFDLESLFYYVVVILISLFLTSPVSVRKARSTILSTIFINIMIERCILNMYVGTIYEDEIINYRSILRSLLLIIILIEFIVHLATYNDLNEQSYVVIESINKKLSGVKEENGNNNSNNNNQQTVDDGKQIKKETKIEKKNKNKNNGNNNNNNNFVSNLFSFIPGFMNGIRERFSNNSNLESDINEVEDNEDIIQQRDQLLYKTPNQKRERNSAPDTLESTARKSNSDGKRRKRRRFSFSGSVRKRSRTRSRSVSKDSREQSVDDNDEIKELFGDEKDILPSYKSPYKSQHRMFNRF